MFQKQIIILFFAILCGCISLQKDPPKPWQTALMARYIIHETDWVSIATISTQKAIIGYPFVSLKSMSDGKVDNGTGVPYLYMTDMDVSGQDIKVDNRCTIIATLAETNYCKSKHFDPQDPRCAKVIITGRVLKIDESSPEYKFGQVALYTRHPSMKWWPKEHNFYVAKVDIEQIGVLDFFGGIKYVSKEEYFNATTENDIFNSFTMDKVEIVEVIA